MSPKLYRAADVCEMAQLQPYVLRSWEKEFPGIGVQKTAESARFYRQSDVEQVLRIKQLVFGEGLTVAGARRRLEDEAPAASRVTEEEAAEVLEVLGADVRSRVAAVRASLRAIYSLLSDQPGEFVLQPPSPTGAAKAVAPPRSSQARVAAGGLHASKSTTRVMGVKRHDAKKPDPGKRRRANA